ncbi:MAG: type II secretion system protein M [Gemmatimonadota bacterium]|nr:MAG: type II secretion system protein M [Gemmatimonadota bacterium]
MRIFHWLSAWYARLNRRERLVVAGGATLSLLALLLVYTILPFARRWSEREAAMEAKVAQVARLEALVEGEAQLEAAVARLEESRDQRVRRLLTGSTPALAASTLQTLMRSYAERSRVRLERVDADREFELAENGLTPIGMQMVVRGDVYGLVDFLFYLQNGEKLLVIDELRITAGAGRTADQQLMAWNVRLHGVYAPPEGSE